MKQAYQDLIESYPIVTTTLKCFQEFSQTQWERTLKVSDHELRKKLQVLQRAITQHNREKVARARQFIFGR